MRIAVLTNAYPPDARGGAGQIAHLQVEGLRARGHEVRVWTVPLTWTSLSLLLRCTRHLLDFVRIDPCAQEIIQWKPERLLTHNLTGIGFRTPSVIQKKNIPWIHILHDVQLFSPSGRLCTWKPVTSWQRLISIPRRFALGSPNVVLSPTETLLQAHRERGFFGSTKSFVLPNPAPVIVRHQRTRRKPLHILFVGRWSQDKGSELIERLWLRPALASIAWTLVGPGTETLLPPNGKGCGPLSVEQILAHMDDADLLLMPSQIMENQPTVLLEAMSHGLPVVASRQAGIEETMGGAGAVCDATDPSAWEQGILKYQHENDQTYASHVDAMYTTWLRHDPDQILQRLADVLVTLN